MIDMFSNYQNLSEYYHPDNLSYCVTTPKSYTKLESNKYSRPYELYNTKGELEGYYWYYGDTLNLDFNIDGEITVEDSAIIYSGSGQAPNKFTEGRLGQKIYNIADLKSWTCTTFIDNTYRWELDSEFTYPEFANRSVYLDASNYLRNTKVTVTLYNFRFEEIHKKTYDGSTSIIFPITEELSRSLARGVYYCSLEVVGEHMRKMLFSPKDCKLLVK